MTVLRDAYLFERYATLEEIREVALRMLCGKIDKEVVRQFKLKEELVSYLHACECPALRILEAKCWAQRRWRGLSNKCQHDFA
jgi:hypothetical protein